jgi:TetR/AcrR family transcriptional regulator, transcriptional repressor for nem operon
MTHDFPDRASLIRAVVAYRSREVLDFLCQAEIEGLDSLEKLRAWARLTVEASGLGGPGVVASLARSPPSSRSATRSLARRSPRASKRGSGGLRKDSAGSRTRGEIGPEADPDQLATSLMAALQGGYTLAQATRDIRPMETALASMIGHIESFAVAGDGAAPSQRRRSRSQSRRRG